MTALFEPTDPFNEEMLAVSDLHTIRFEQVGRPGGRPALFLHGGPGVGILPGYRRFFDPAYYMCVLPDQRGAGRSTPHAELTENTTWDLIDDLERLREHLNIDRWVVLGGSWGSLLALCYAIRHPERIEGLILRGVFLGRQRDIDWVYGGAGTARLFPDEWRKFREPVTDSAEADTVRAYHKLLTGDDGERAKRAARCWAEYGASTMTLTPDPNAVAEIASDENILPLARLECHYMLNRLFLPDDNYVLANANVLKSIPCRIVHGRYDAICDVGQAYELHRALPRSQLTVAPDGGHSPMEGGMAAALVEATRSMQRP